MNLIIVESPTKAKTFAFFFKDDNYQITSSYGHIRDLPKSRLGIAIENGFEPEYELIPKKNKVVKELLNKARGAKTIVLATDPDREGEAIAYHISVLLKDKLKKSAKFVRIVFHEITKEAVFEALKNPRSINMELFYAQQARRVLDRLVGYKISPYLWKRFSKRWLSAGRVQTVALRFIVEREKERQKFKSEKYYLIKAVFTDSNKKAGIEAKLIQLQGESFIKTNKIKLFDGEYSYQTTLLNLAADVEKHKQRLLKEKYIIKDIVETKVKRTPPPPFTTSTLQQYASTYLGFNAKKTMSLAQSLYEHGLITYHRTDSLHVAEKFIESCRGYIVKKYGEKYLSSSPRRFKTKSKLAQEAHEAIRPTNVARDANSDSIKKLSRDHLRLYTAIYLRSIATQMQDATVLKQKIFIHSDSRDVFVAEAEEILFPGFLLLNEDKIKAGVVIKNLQSGDKLNLDNLITEEKETLPPPYYTEANLIKTLEERGIGRPSTYAPTVSLIQQRQYVKREGKALIPTELGVRICDLLVDKFKDIFDIDFTAGMEDELDNISVGKKDWQKVVASFFTPLAKQLETAYKDNSKIRVEEETNELCPDCGGKLVIKLSRFGKFYACANFPKCKYTKSYLQKTKVTCPKCGEGELIVRFSRKGKRFYACDRYPKCDFTSLWLPKAKSQSQELEE